MQLLPSYLYRGSFHPVYNRGWAWTGSQAIEVCRVRLCLASRGWYWGQGVLNWSVIAHMRVQRSLPRLTSGLRWTHVSAITVIVTAIVCFSRIELGGALPRVCEAIAL